MPELEGHIGEQPVVSVVVAARDAASDIPKLLEVLENQTLARDQFEVVVVDDGSRDETASIVQRSPLARLVRAPGHVGLPAARNLGIKAARAPIIAMTDADCIPDRTWLARGVERFRAEDVDILAGGVTIDLPRRPSVAALLDAARFLNPEQSVSQGYATGANVWVRRAVFEEVGLFNEGLAAYGHDDKEFGQYATEQGARLEYGPEAHVTHPSRWLLRQLARKAYRLALGCGPLRAAGRGPARHASRFYSQPRLWRPRGEIAQLQRLHARGVYPGALTRAGMFTAQYVFIDLPWVVGDLIGELRARRRASPRREQQD